MSKHKGLITTLSISAAIILLAVASYISTTFNTSSDEKLTVGSRAAESSPSCPYDSGQTLQLGTTETDSTNAENRWPISQHRHEYDIFGDSYFNFVSNNNPSILNLTYSDGGHVDPLMNGFMGSMFGYKPATVTAYDVKYNQAPRGNDTEIKGNAPVLGVPTTPRTPVKVPTTGYDIGGGFEAMVVFADANRVTLHVGRHEYFVGSKKCKDGNTCSGGYWIYVKDICVDQKILSAYNSVKGAQESAGANLNPIQLPMVRPGQILGNATGNQVIVGVRDNGPFISTSKPIYWEGVGGKSDFPSAPNTDSTVNPPSGDPSSGSQIAPPANTKLNCVEIANVAVDLGNTNKIAGVKIFRKDNGKEGSIKVGYINSNGQKEHIQGPNDLPDNDNMVLVNGDASVKGSDGSSRFINKYDLGSGKDVKFIIDVLSSRQKDPNENLCTILEYICKNDKGSVSCSPTGSTAAPTTKPQPQQPNQPPATQATPTPTPSSNFVRAIQRLIPSGVNNPQETPSTITSTNTTIFETSTDVDTAVSSCSPLILDTLTEFGLNPSMGLCLGN